MKSTLLLVLAACAVVRGQKAVATFKWNTITGTVKFQTTDNETVLVVINVENLVPEGLHGFHIHTFGDLSGGCVTAGSHFNPNNMTHGAPEDTVRHIGDLGNIRADGNGTVISNMTDTLIKLTGPHSIIGRAVVLHALPDDLGRGMGDKQAESKKTGNAGGRVACAVIGLADY